MNLSSDDFQAQLAMRTVILDQARVASRINLPAHIWSTATIGIDQEVNFLVDELILQMEAFVLRETLPPETVKQQYTLSTPSVPVTWWDHFKVDKAKQDRWYWRWLGKLKAPQFAVEVKTVELSVDLRRYWAYPEAQPVPAQYGRAYKQCNYETRLIWDV